MIVGVSVKFDAAHFLPTYDGKCKEMHGHTWHVEVEVSGKVNYKSGMVVDLAILKRDVNELINRFDHKLVNDVMEKVPTCENVVVWLLEKLSLKKYKVASIKVREGEGGWARL